MPPLIIPDISFSSVAPELILCLTALVVLVMDIAVKKIEPINITLTSFIGILIAFFSTQMIDVSGRTAFEGLILRDSLGTVLEQIFLIGAALIVLHSHRYAVNTRIPYGEYIVLLLFSTLGMLFIAVGSDLVTLFLGIELVSLPLYALAGIEKDNLLSGEASLKYFLLGAFSTGFMVYGMAFLFGVCRTTNLIVIGQNLLPGGAVQPLLILGFAFLLVGLGFKISLVPFHMWAPDVYQGAPTPVAAWIATGSKMAGFVALLRVFSLPGTSFAPLAEYWIPGVFWLSLLTMIVGNAGALVQTDLKRLLAYSSIAHGGYLSMALVSNNEVGTQAILFYLAAYMFMTVGAFGVVLAVRKNGRECRTLSDLAGLSDQHPGLAMLMAVFMLALAGMPFTAGFVGKVWLFGAAVQAGYLSLAIVGILTTLLSFYYYLRVIVYMYMHEAEEGAVFETPAVSSNIALGFSAFFVLILGLFPNILWHLIAAGIKTV